MHYTVRAFRGFDSHETKILNRDELPQAVRAAFLSAVAAGQIRIEPGFPQDAEDFLFDFSGTPDVEETPAGGTSPFGRCKECGRVGLMTTLPGRGICDDCA